MRIFLTGATGFIGGHVARILLARGDRVTALVRDPRRAGPLEDLGAEPVTGDIRDEAGLDMAGCDAAVHLAAWYDVGARNPEAHEVNVEGTRHVLRQMVEQGVARGVYVSTLAVHGDTRGALVDEGHVHRGRFLSLYDETKWRAHHEVAVPAQDDLELVIAMPGVVYGPDDPGPMGDLLRAYIQQALPAVPRDAAHCWGHVEDTAAGIVACLDRGRAGAAYHLAGPAHRLTEVLAMAEEITGIPVPRRRLGRTALRTASALMRIPDLVLDLPKTYHPEALRVAPATYLGDATRARRELGWDPRPLRDGLTEVLPELIRGH